MGSIAFNLVRSVQPPAPAPPAWRFDVLSALVGAGAALLLAGLIYGFRGALRQWWEALGAALSRLHHYLRASAEEEYRELVAEWARSVAVAAHLAPLDAVFVEPRLLAPRPLLESISAVERADTAPPALPLRRVLGGHTRLAILGGSGMGTTAALAHLALLSVTSPVEGGGEAEAMGPLVKDRLPFYVSLAAMDWVGPEEETAKKSGGLDKLLNAAVAIVGGSAGVVGPLRTHVETGQAIVLADGWDDLLPDERRRAAAWLDELMDRLPGNLWLVASGMRNYGALTESGFVPLTLAQWDAGQVEAFAGRWLETCASPDDSSPVPLRELVAILRRAVRSGSSPMELTLRALVHVTERRSPTGRAALFDRALDLLLLPGGQGDGREEESWLLVTCRAALGQVALELQQSGWTAATSEEIRAAIEAVLPPPAERPKRAGSRVFRTMTGKRKLLRPVAPNRYAFAHRLWQAYLAARQLMTADPSSLLGRLEDPRWSEVLRFYGELGDIGPLVAACLRGPDDLFHTRLLTLSSWVSVAPRDAAWRDGTMAVLARALLEPGIPASTRQALAKAMAATGAPGVAYFLKQTLQHADPGVRSAAILGLARAATESDVAVIGMALFEEDPVVREAAVHALAEIGTDAARHQLAQVLTEGDEVLRVDVANVLAGFGEQSVELLRGLMESEDVVTRRAAVFGLAQAGARDLLQEIAREDEQWAVRSAASAALEELQEQEEISGVAPLPEVERLPWLVSWAATHGQGVGAGDAARQMLRRALREGDDAVRLAAARVLGQIGHRDEVEPLQAALADPDPGVASAAFEALRELSGRYGLSIEKRSDA